MGWTQPVHRQRYSQDHSWGYAAGFSSPRTNGLVLPDGRIREDQRRQDVHLPPPGATPQPRWPRLGR